MNSILICANGQFKHLCSQGFSENEAIVGCRDLTFVTGSKWTYINDTYNIIIGLKKTFKNIIIIIYAICRSVKDYQITHA